ncbi:hypothetical protein GCM10027259_18060 [Micromonospora palomenae]
MLHDPSGGDVTRPIAVEKTMATMASGPVTNQACSAGRRGDDAPADDDRRSAITLLIGHRAEDRGLMGVRSPSTSLCPDLGGRRRNYGAGGAVQT